VGKIINHILKDIRVGKVTCTNEYRLGAGSGFLVWLTANINGYNFGTNELGLPKYDAIFKGETINEAMEKAIDFLRYL